MTPSEIRRLRGDRTRVAFATTVGVNAHTVYRWELPETSPHARRPRGDVLGRLARLARTAASVSGEASALPVMAALQRMLDGQWREAEGVFLRAHGDREANAEARTLASTGLALIELIYRADSRRALASLGPALAPDAVPNALTEATAALAYSYPDGELFDLGRVHTHAARAEQLARPEAATSRALAVMAEANAAMLAGNDDLLARALARVDAIAAAALPEVPALFLAQLRSLAATLAGNARLAMDRLEQLLANPRISICPVLEARTCAARAMRLLEDLGDPLESLALARRARTIADEARLAPGVHSALALRSEAESLLRLCRLDELPPVFAESDRILAEHGFPVTVVLPIQARYLLATGRPDEIDALAARIGAVELPSMRVVCQAYAAWLTAMAHMSRGGAPDATLAAYAYAEQQCNGWGMMERDLLVAYASAAVVDGTPVEARRILERALRAADRRPAAWVTASLRRCEGILLVEEGRADEGRMLFDSAVATFAASGDRLDATLASYGSAGMHVLHGMPGAAAKQAAALAALASFGLPRPTWIDRAIARVGRGGTSQPQPRSVGAPLQLELALQRLAVAGATTPMVMRELAAVARDLAGVPVVIEEPGAATDPAIATWLDIDGGSGRRLRLGLASPPTAEVRAALRVVALVAGLALEVAALRGGAREAQTPETMPEMPGVIAVAAPMRRLLADVARLAQSRATVVITGESGAGKEVIARALHDLSPRAALPYVPFNCASVPHDLFEGQLFGYRKGAFTGATADHLGVVRAADHGTVFLDEIGELPLDIQPKLLRFLDSGEVFPLGAQRPIHVDVRVVAATNRDLATEVARGRFREDLFYRLQVVPLVVPPLRDRRDDIVPLARHFARALAPAGRAPAFAPDALAALVAHPWPGNVRELRNVIERGMAYADTPDLLTRAELGL